MQRSWIGSLIVAGLLTFPSAAYAAAPTGRVSPVVIPAAKPSPALVTAANKASATTQRSAFVASERREVRKAEPPVLPPPLELSPIPPRERTWSNMEQKAEQAMDRATNHDPDEQIERAATREEAWTRRIDTDRANLQEERQEAIAERWESSFARNVEARWSR